jgi:hypothetical protein
MATQRRAAESSSTHVRSQVSLTRHQPSKWDSMDSRWKETGVLCVEDNTSSLHKTKRKHTWMERRTDLFLFPRNGQRCTSLIQTRKFFTSPVNKVYLKNRNLSLKNAIYKSLFLFLINYPASVNNKGSLQTQPPYFVTILFFGVNILLTQIFQAYVLDSFVCDIRHRF